MSEKKTKPLKLASNIKKVTVKMPGELKKILPQKILGDGYNMRQKSKWVVEAVESLICKKDWEGALLSETITKPDSQDVFSVPVELVNQINMEAARITMNQPHLKANQSSIIRAAINRRLLGFFKKQGVQ
jgi:hypothetical protein